MWIYPARLGILIPGGLRPIAPCSPLSLGWQAVIAILRSRLRGPDCRSFLFSHAPTLIIDSIVGLLVGCSRDQFAQHWSDR